ncbi:aconitate hydratase AcnA [bacterium]|nr:aconitate hydratase AcnA [bacterium]
MTEKRALDSFGARDRLATGAGDIEYFRLSRLEDEGLGKISRLPFSIKVLLETIVRGEDGRLVTKDNVASLAGYDPKNPGSYDVPYMPARVLMQDFTGVPAIVDLAALRSAMKRFGKKPSRINPILPVDLVVDHSVQVDVADSPKALQVNASLEFSRNRERYEFLKWGQEAFENFRVVPPANGICHQVNLEYLARVVQTKTANGATVAFPDSLVGTDSHTTMINGLGVLGWGVGGIEAEAVMLGQPLFMLPPPVVGFRLSGELPAGATATDLVLTVTEMLRKRGVVDQFVEFFGEGLAHLTLPDRATIANMSPEFGARCAFFPVDEVTLEYLRYTNRGEVIDLARDYLKAQGLFHTKDTPDPEYNDVVELDLSTVTPSVAGPKRPQDRVALSDMKTHWREVLHAPVEKRGFGLDQGEEKAAVELDLDGTKTKLRTGDVVIAAITSCTNTSNPYVMIGAGLVAKNAVERGLSVPPYVKTSLAPGSKVVTDYLNDTHLTEYLDKLGFYTVGYGCTTCIGNSGPLDAPIAKAIEEGRLVVGSVLSGNRNFEGRVHQLTRANYLMSPMLVVAYAIAGRLDIDLQNDPLGKDQDGNDVFLADIWPTGDAIREALAAARDPNTYKREYGNVEAGNEDWNRVAIGGGEVYDWKDESTYIQEPPFFVDLPETPPPASPIENARVLLLLGDTVTTDHISPAGAIKKDSPAGRYLLEHGVDESDFNSYGSRRGNDRVMARGTFANIRIRNRIGQGKEGGYTTHFPSGELMSVYDAAMRYKEDGVPLVVIGGQDYGMGSSRDWAAKGTNLLGVRAVIAKSYETIHRANLVGMGVLPLQFGDGEDADTLGLTGEETFTIDLPDRLSPRQEIEVAATSKNGSKRTFKTVSRLNSPIDVEYYRHGGILNLVLREFVAGASD